MKVTILLALVGVGLALPTGDQSAEPKPKPIQIEPTKVGGYNPADVNDKDVQEMALFVASFLNAGANNIAYSVGTVLSAERQVVAGVNYKLTLTFNRSDGDVQRCEVIVFDQAWTNTREVTSIACVL